MHLAFCKALENKHKILTLVATQFACACGASEVEGEHVYHHLYICEVFCAFDKKDGGDCLNRVVIAGTKFLFLLNYVFWNKWQKQPLSGKPLFLF